MLSPILLVPRQQVPWWLRAATFSGGIALGLGISFGLLVVSGVAPGAIVDEFIVFVFLDLNGLAHVVTKSATLALVGLASAAALKLKFWNIGVEGQLWLGALAATGVATFDLGPPQTRLVLMFATGALAGALWIAIPAFLKLRFGINEIIMTLLMSYIAYLFVQHMVFGAWQDPGTKFPVSAHYDEGIERLARLGWGSAHTGLFIALGACAAMWALMNLSRFGFYMDAIGANPAAAHAAGLPVTLTIAIAALMSGGLAGIAGVNVTAGEEYRLTQYIGQGYTFSGIAIAFIARFRPLPILITAVVVGGVYTAGDTLKVFYQLPEAIVLVIEGAILLSLIVVEFFGRYHITLAAAARKAQTPP